MKKIIAVLGLLLSTGVFGVPTTPGTPVCSSSSATAISCTWTASTEWGAPVNGTPSVTETQQADDYVTSGFNILRTQKTWSGPAFWFTVRDGCVDTANFNCWFGLTDRNWLQRSSYASYKSLTVVNETVLTAPINFHRDP